MEKINMPEAFGKIWEFIKKSKYVLAVLFVGLVLILLPKENEEKLQENTSRLSREFSLSEEEMRISKALSEIDGAGKVTVVLTVKSSEETVIAKNTESYALQEEGETRQETSTSVVIISEGSQKEAPVTVQVIYPEYQGALVVAEGAENAEIRLRLTQAISDLTGLSSEKITVVKMKSS